MHFAAMRQVVQILAFFAPFWIGVHCGPQEMNIQLTGLDAPAYGPFYCQARCLASCIETNLATSLEECGKHCPPIDTVMPCQNDDCWRNCGIPSTPRDKPPPPAVNFVMAQHASLADDRLQDPFTIELTWDPAPSASLYIVELYPLNRAPRPGENNFFRALTSFPTYLVRKEDECTIYDIRVMPVNAFGVGAPQYTRIEAPRPAMSSADFLLRNIQYDPSSDYVIVAINYAIPSTWPVSDVDMNGVRVRGTDCRGFAKQNATANADDVWYPFYEVKVEKGPTPNFKLAFSREVLKADCLFQMRVSALTTRCNTTTYFDSNGSASQDSTVGVDFRINCLTAEGVDCDGPQSAPLADHRVMPDPPQSAIDPSPAPALVTSRNETASSPIAPDTGAIIVDIPTDAIGNAANVPEAASGISGTKMHPFLIDYLAINSQFQVPMSCDIDTLNVQATPSSSLPSLIDLTVSWIEQNPMPQRQPSYFLVRYGPAMRTLVDDIRRPRKILPGYANVVRSGRQDGVSQFLQNSAAPERELKITAVPRNSLISVQVCAIYDTNIEQMILWDVIESQYIDLMALETSPDQLPPDSITSLPTLITDESPPSAASSERHAANEENRFGVEPSLGHEDIENGWDKSAPVVIQVGLVDGGRSTLKLWSTLAGGVLAAIVLAIAALLAVLRLWSKRGDKKLKMKSYPVFPIATITEARVQTGEQTKKPLENTEPEKVALP